MIHIETDLYGPNPPGSSWWDVPVSEVSRLESTQQARPDLAHLVSFPGVVDGVEPGLDVVGDGVFSGDDGVAGLDVDGSVAA